MKEKRIENLIRNEEIEEAMNKLPINERAIIKDVLQRIKSDNHQMFLDKLAMARNEYIRERNERSERSESSFMANVCIMCAGGSRNSCLCRSYDYNTLDDIMKYMYMYISYLFLYFTKSL
jgi:hypothetical protein